MKVESRDLLEYQLLTPIKAIRKSCINCAGSMGEVRKCPATSCPLHPYRMGRNPNRRGIGGPGAKRPEKCPA
jgi:hypothetical protein